MAPRSRPSAPEPAGGVIPAAAPNSGPPTLLGLPYDASSSFSRGAAAAPPKIREALFSSAGNAYCESGLAVLDGALRDEGDLALGDDGAAARLEIEAGVDRLLARGARPILLGGDHSVTFPVLLAFARHLPELTVLHVDAHADLYDEFDGDRFSHACPFARALEAGAIGRLVQVGIRTLTPHLREQAARFGVEIVDMRAWTAGVRPRLAGPCYLSLDLDGLDPACAPGVVHREPGGLTVREVLGLIQNLPTPFVGADVVELHLGHDLDGVTAAVAAKLVKEIAGRMLEPTRG